MDDFYQYKIFFISLLMHIIACLLCHHENLFLMSRMNKFFPTYSTSLCNTKEIFFWLPFTFYIRFQMHNPLITPIRWFFIICLWRSDGPNVRNKILALLEVFKMIMAISFIDLLKRLSSVVVRTGIDITIFSMLETLSAQKEKLYFTCFIIKSPIWINTFYYYNHTIN